MGIGQSVFKGLRAARTTQAHVDDLCAVVGRKVDPLGYCRIAAAATAVENLDRHNRGVVGNAGNPGAVVGALGDGASDMSAVPLVVVWMGIIIDKVVAGNEICVGQIRGLRISDGL